MNESHRLSLVLLGGAGLVGRRRSVQDNATWSDQRGLEEVVKHPAYSTWHCEP